MRESEGETPDSGDVTPPGESADCVAVTGCLRAPLSLDRRLCAGKQQRNCACTAAGISGPNVNMRNGDVDRTGHGADVALYERTGRFPGPVLGHRFGLSEMDSGQVKVPNGGLHIVNADRATCVCNTDIHVDQEVRKENGAGSGFGPRSPSDCSGTSFCQSPGDGAPAAADNPASVPPQGSSSLGLCAKLVSRLNGDRPLSEPSFRDAEEDFSDFSFPVRPQSLRTHRNHGASLSCDATPLTPDEDGGFYFGDGEFTEDLRNVLEVGRRQSAPDKLPDLTERTVSPDTKLIPKRFGIADFFTR